jgi:hypothetical protein
LRAKPEQTQLEDLSDASFLGKLLVLPANVRLDWTVIARHKHSCLFGIFISKEKINFYNIDTWTPCFVHEEDVLEAPDPEVGVGVPPDDVMAP